MRIARHVVYATVGLAAGCLIAIGPARPETAGPFARLVGLWSGSGSIQLSNGARERIRCRANYLSRDATSLNLELRCASESYNFGLASHLRYHGGSISGVWTEATRGVGGNVAGSATGDHIRAVADGPTFRTLLELTTANDRQHIRLQSPGSEIAQVSISMNRSSRTSASFGE